MGMGHQAGAEMLARQAREAQRRIGARKQRIHNRIRTRSDAEDADRPQEMLACPQCGERYEFGRICPDCEVELVGASVADLVPPRSIHERLSWRIVPLVFALGAATVGVLVVCFLVMIYL